MFRPEPNGGKFFATLMCFEKSSPTLVPKVVSPLFAPSGFKRPIREANNFLSNAFLIPKIWVPNSSQIHGLSPKNSLSRDYASECNRNPQGTSRGKFLWLHLKFIPPKSPSLWTNLKEILLIGTGKPGASVIEREVTPTVPTSCFVNLRFVTSF